ncbi:MAG TPA: ABC transporter permease [Ignavibacteriaceae bacterium]|nr:ABC transporter permease [Ignavibacteriaceae bacterium]
MSFPFFVSKKFIFSRKGSKFITFISSISIIGIALGVATLIIALSILTGFAATLTNKIIDFDSHITISSYKSIVPDYERMLPVIKQLISPYGEEINPFISKLAIISSKNLRDGVNIKGITPDNNALRIRNNIVAGNFNLTNLNSIVIGRKLADKLYVGLGDKVTIFALKNDKIPEPGSLPNIEQFVITGIFESGMTEYDDLYAYVNLKSAQKLFSLGDNVNGYDIKLNNISKIDSLTKYLGKNLHYPHKVASIYQTHRNIFTWIDLQKKPIPIILGLIIIVAVFNIIGTLLMIVLEKTHDIGLLKSLGSTRGQIVNVFIYQGIFLAIIGIIAGNLLALLLMGMQLEFNVISLPSSVYFVSTVPIMLKWYTFAGVSALTFILCIVASIIPSYIASKITPVNSLRFG